MKKLILAAGLLAGTALASVPAQADTLLTFSTLANPVVQSESAPCIICATMQAHNPAGFGFNNFINTGQTDGGNFFSTALVGGSLASGNEAGAVPYTTSQIIAALANHISFGVAIDVNSAEGGNPPTIMSLDEFDLFRVDANNTNLERLAHFTGPQAMPDVRPGNGKGDYLLSGFDLTGLNAGDKLIFRAQFSGGTDGGDSFYLVPFANGVPVPGPVVGAGLPGLLAACGGMFGLNFYRRRRTQISV